MREGILWSKLHCLASKGALDEIKSIVDDVEIDQQVNGGYTPLYIAMEYGHFDVARFLISKGADLNAKVVNKTKIRLYREYKYTLIDIATMKGKIDIVKFIMDYGVSPVIPEKLLYLAIEEGHLNIVQLLLPMVDVNVKIQSDNSLIHIAARYGKDDIVRLLIENGADVNILDGYNRTPLISALMSARSKHKKTIRLLLNSGADATKYSTVGKNSLIYAVESNRSEVVDLVLSQFNNIDHASTLVYALYLAVKNGLYNTTKAILVHGVPKEEGVHNIFSDILGGSTIVDQGRRRRIEPLIHLAIKTRNLRIVKLLVQYKADLSVCFEGISPLELAVDKKFLEIVKYLAECLYGEDAYREICEKYAKEVLTYIVDCLRYISRRIIQKSNSFSLISLEEIILKFEKLERNSQYLSRFIRDTENTETVPFKDVKTLIKCINPKIHSLRLQLKELLGYSKVHPIEVLPYTPCRVCKIYPTCHVRWSSIGCGHVFHTKCINSWLMHSSKCPVCGYGEILQ